MRHTGVTARGIVTPIFRQGDDLVELVCKSLVDAAKAERFSIQDGDIIGITEAVVGRTQGNYATCEQIAAAIKAAFGGGELGIVFPILSRNRFSVLLRAIAMATPKLYVQLSYPCDEVGNGLVTHEMIEESGVNPYTDTFTVESFRKVFGEDTVHPFTGIDYVSYYQSISDNIEVVFANDPRHILTYTKHVLVCDIHSRFRTQRRLASGGAEKVLRLDEILTKPFEGSGHSEFGLLGSNKATEDTVKLFPRDTQAVVDAIQARVAAITGRHVEVLVYGDGGFKDPRGGIWELADPVISPAFTQGLRGTPNELKIKYIADNEFAHLSGEALTEALRRRVAEKSAASLVGHMHAEGTTPRQITDLVGSLCDLVSGSGDRGTPVILVQNYFTNYASK